MVASARENFPGTRKPYFLICGWAGSSSTLEKIREGQSDEQERVGVLCGLTEDYGVRLKNQSFYLTYQYLMPSMR